MKPMVLITWIDSTNHTTGWTYETETKTIDIVSCGFLMEETDGVMVISHSIGFQGSHFDSFVIPKGCIKEVVKLDTKTGKAQVQQRNRKKG